ncbi:hypothetical protein STAFG_2960 [Streptomyces afghaniensis 772]|uniref:Uncharacterized protein n=1 Tax=Streptomyces afghaniensis 772 TaxID=1283301 RepID=S4MVW9_9ACTN|nr:hypothetical protein STAFG_2960 [Streptomyces afghaniensis 772]
MRDVVRVQRAGAPGVVARGGQAGQQPAARGQPQGVQGGGAPAGGGGVGRGVAAGRAPAAEGPRPAGGTAPGWSAAGPRRRAVVRP